MKVRRVLFTIPNFDTAGSGKALLAIAKRLDCSRFEAHILCNHRKGEFFKEVENSGIPVHIGEFTPSAKPYHAMLFQCWRVRNILKKIGPDLIHSFHYSDNYTEALSAKIAGIKWVFTKKNMMWDGSSGNGWRLRSLLAFRIALQNSDMKKMFYPKTQKAKIIPSSVDVEAYRLTLPSASIRDYMKTGKNDRIIITVAHLLPIKGIDTLIRAFASEEIEKDNWSLWIVGEDKSDYGRSLHELVEDLGLTDKVKFSGKVENVNEYLNHAEIFVLPTQFKGEGCPIALLEAMANEKVVIGSGVPGIKDQLNDFPSQLFEPGSVEQLAELLKVNMSRDSEENHRLGLEFYDFVKNNYDISLEVDRYQEFYTECFK